MLSTSISVKAFKSLASITKATERPLTSYVQVRFLPDRRVYFDVSDGIMALRYITRSHEEVSIDREYIVFLEPTIARLPFKGGDIIITVDTNKPNGSYIISEAKGTPPLTIPFDPIDVMPHPFDDLYDQVAKHKATSPTHCDPLLLSKACEALDGILKAEGYTNPVIELHIDGDEPIYIHYEPMVQAIVMPCRMPED